MPFCFISRLMLPLIASTALLLPGGVLAADRKVDKDCLFQGKKLYGKIKVVENFEDIKVKVVENFPDLKVQVVENFPNQCGKWKFVDSFADLKIKFVEHFQDVSIKFVDNFPGLP